MIKNDKSGFSLLELLVVLVIMGVAASLVGIRISGSMDQVQVMAASGKIAAGLKWARTKAITERAVYLASIDIEADRFSVRRQKASEIEANIDNIDNEAESDPGQSRHRTLSYQLPDGLSFVKGISVKNEKYTDLFEIEFYPSGNSSGGEIFLSDKAENLSRIRVNFITGIVEVDERLADSG